MPTYTCRSYRESKRALLSLKPSAIRSFRDSRSVRIAWKTSRITIFRGLKSQLVNVSFTIFSFKELKFSKAKQPNRVLTFANKATLRLERIPYISPQIQQTEDFWIIDKSELAKVGLVPRLDNSLAELISSFILYNLDGRLDSTQIKIILFKYTSYVENDIFLECQSFIIDWFLNANNNNFPPKL